VMCTSHSVMEGQRHNNPLNPRCFCLQRPKRDGGWSWLLTHAIVEAVKALGGSFKLVTLAPKTVREMTQLIIRYNKQTYGPTAVQRNNSLRTPICGKEIIFHTAHAELENVCVFLYSFCLYVLLCVFPLALHNYVSYAHGTI